MRPSFRKICRLLFSAIGYLSYSIVVLLFFLWYLFPAETVQAWSRQQAARVMPGYSWQIGKIAFAVPPALHIDQVRVSGIVAGREIQVEDLGFKLLRPLSLWREKKVSWSWRGNLGGGTVNGTLWLQRDGSVELAAKLTGLNLQDELFGGLERPLSGTLQGNLQYAGKLGEPMSSRIALDLLAQQGSIGLKEPVLGMKQLEFSRISVRCSGNTTLHCSDGQVDGRLLAAKITGEVGITRPLAASRLKFSGEITPRSELLAALGTGPEADLVRLRAKAGVLPFVISGTTSEPGIVFPGSVSAPPRSGIGVARGKVQ